MTWFILAAFFLWRIGLFFVSWWGSAMLPFVPRFPYADVYLIPSGLPQWLWSFANFDGVHYIAISRYGYAAQFTQVFFPLQPMIFGFLHRLIPFVSDIALGITFTSLCLALSLWIFRRLLLLDYSETEVRWIVLFLLVFPTSFFFGSLYTESFFLLLMFMSFYYARKNRPVLAGFFGALASATRIIGIFLLPALLWEQWEQRKVKSQKSKVKSTSQKLKVTQFPGLLFTYILSLLYSPLVYLIPLGLFAYMAYLQIFFGDWLYFWHAQPVFGAQRSGGSIILLPQVVWRYGKILMTLPIYSESFWIAALELTSTLGCLSALYAAYRAGVRTSYIIFSLCAVLLPTLTGTFSSMPRYVLMAFPIYIILGTGLSRNMKIAALIFSSVFLIILTVLFTRGHWVA